MDEITWLTSDDPQALLESLWNSGTVSDRKLRLLVCAVGRACWETLVEHELRAAVEVIEQYVDGEAREAQLLSATHAASSCGRLYGPPRPGLPVYSPEHVAIYTNPTLYVRWAGDREYLGMAAHTAVRDLEPSAARRLLHELFGNAWRLPAVVPSWLECNNGATARLAAVTYAQRQLSSGHLDAGLLGILADALEDAGCTDPDILAHCRGPGPHVRGCWALDLLTGRA